jgi:hypothetical protein
LAAVSPGFQPGGLMWKRGYDVVSCLWPGRQRCLPLQIGDGGARMRLWQPVYQSRFAFAVVLIIFPDWFELKIRGHEQGIHPHRRRA